MINYQKKLEKIKQAADRKEARLKKRLELAKNKPKKISKKSLRNILQRLTNKIVRLRYPPICYTCDEPITKGLPQAGHCWTQAGHPYARFDFDNLRIQGTCCNHYKSGNHTEFSYRLQKELGPERWETLYQRAHSKLRYSEEELLQLIEERKIILNQLKT